MYERQDSVVLRSYPDVGLLKIVCWMWDMHTYKITQPLSMLLSQISPAPENEPHDREMFGWRHLRTAATADTVAALETWFTCIRPRILF